MSDFEIEAYEAEHQPTWLLDDSEESMTREDKIEIARRFAEWVAYTASVYLTEENDVLSVIKCVLFEIDKAESEV